MQVQIVNYRIVEWQGEFETALDAIRPTKPLWRLAARAVCDQLVVINLQQSTFHVLNRLGARIWAAVDGRRTMAEIVNCLHADYEIERPQLERDCRDFLAALHRAGILDIVPLSGSKDS